MSWQPYIDTNLLGDGLLTEAAILGHDGLPWARSTNIEISIEEAKKIFDGFDSAEDIQASGFHISGVKYITLKVNPNSIYGRSGADGIVCFKTKKAMIFGVYKGPVRAEDAVEVVDKLGQYLISTGFVNL